MQYPSILLALLPAVTSALPHIDLLPRHDGGSISSITLPASSLPAPDPSLVLKYVALGLGTQNYTCASTPHSSTAAPASAGAVADLFDASPLLSKGSDDEKATMERVLTGLSLSIFEKEHILPDQFPGGLKMQHIGKHFFAAGLVPSFVLSEAKPPAQIAAKKVAGVPAPANACPGGQGEGAVDWLQLVDNGLGFSKGTPLEGGDVYRVETAGGKSPATCADNDGAFEVQYAALYFFFGPGR